MSSCSRPEEHVSVIDVFASPRANYVLVLSAALGKSLNLLG